MNEAENSLLNPSDRLHWRELSVKSYCCAQNRCMLLVNTLCLTALKIKNGWAATNLNPSLTSDLFVYLIC